MNYYVMTATVENALMVLQRMASIFSRNRMQVRHINVIEMDQNGRAHLSISFLTDQENVEKLLKQFKKIIELLEITIN